MPHTVALHTQQNVLLRDLLLIALVVILSFGTSYNFGFVYDDLGHIVNNPLVVGHNSLSELFSKPLFPGNLYRPLTVASFALTYKIFGLSPLSFHLIHLLLQILVSSVGYLFLRRLIPTTSALIASLLFAAHPLHTEVVANCAAQSELLAAFFILASLYVVLRCSHDLYGALISASFSTAAFFSKESALCVIPFLLLLSCAKLYSKKRGLLVLIFTGCGALFYLLCRSQALQGVAPFEIDPVDNPLSLLPWYGRFFEALVLLGRYLQLVALPFNLSADYSFDTLPLGDEDPISKAIQLTLVIAALYAAIRNSRSSKETALLILWFFVFFLITSNILSPIGTIFAERLAYLPSFGIIGACVYSFWLHCPASLRIKYLLSSVVIAAAIVSSFYVTQRWRSNQALFEYQLLRSPRSVKTLINGGDSAFQRNDLQGAELFLRKALEVYPRSAEATFGVGLISLKRGNVVDAEQWFRKALQFNNQFTPALTQLGRLLITQGKAIKAQEYLERAYSNEPDNKDILSGLLAAYLAQGEREKARVVFQQLKRVAPPSAALSKLEVELKR